MKKNPSIFLSYAHEDAIAAKRLCESLRSYGREVWFDRDSLKGGELWKPAIESAIESSDYFIALLSDASIDKRGVVQSEIKKGLDVLSQTPEDSIFLIPVRLTPCKPKYAKLKELHWVDLFPDWNEGIKHILRSTSQNIGDIDTTDMETPFIKTSNYWEIIVNNGFSKIEENKEVFRASDVIMESIDSFSNYSNNRNIGVRFHDEAPSSKVFLNRDILKMALYNILHNAIKYSHASDKHKYSVDISLRKIDLFIEITIENWGIGIDEIDKLSENIFLFGYLKSNEIKDNTGSGVGLHVAKNIIDKLCGEIRVKSLPVRHSIDGQKFKNLYVTRVCVHLPLYKT